MIRSIFEPLLRRFGRATVHSAPTPYERGLGHVAYLVGLGLLGWVGLGLAGIAVPVGIGTGLKVLMLAAALSFLFLFWAVTYRRVPPEAWFVSHLVWLSMTYAFLFLAGAGGALALMVGILFIAVVPPLAALVVYGPMVVGGLVALWFTWRMVRGYVAYLGGAAVGGMVRTPAVP